jgi:hypothetical protein
MPPFDDSVASQSIKAKFGVTATFTKLHEFIQADGLTSQPDLIQLGDWINLEGGREVATYLAGSPPYLESVTRGVLYSAEEAVWP